MLVFNYTRAYITCNFWFYSYYNNNNNILPFQLLLKTGKDIGKLWLSSSAHTKKNLLSGTKINYIAF